MKKRVLIALVAALAVVAAACAADDSASEAALAAAQAAQADAAAAMSQATAYTVSRSFAGVPSAIRPRVFSSPSSSSSRAAQSRATAGRSSTGKSRNTGRIVTSWPMRRSSASVISRSAAETMTMV